VCCATARCRSASRRPHNYSLPAGRLRWPMGASSVRSARPMPCRSLNREQRLAHLTRAGAHVRNHVNPLSSHYQKEVPAADWSAVIAAPPSLAPTRAAVTCLHSPRHVVFGLGCTAGVCKCGIAAHHRHRVGKGECLECIKYPEHPSMIALPPNVCCRTRLHALAAPTLGRSCTLTCAQGHYCLEGARSAQWMNWLGIEIREPLVVRTTG
jgi:hypothetical protein